MVRPGRDRLSGRVEVDETYLGALEEGVRGRQTDAKALIVVAAEEDGAGIGRVRMRTIPNASGDSLMAFVGESVEPGSVVLAPADGGDVQGLEKKHVVFVAAWLYTVWHQGQNGNSG